MKILLLCKRIFKYKKFMKLLLRSMQVNVKYARYLTGNEQFTLQIEIKKDINNVPI